MLSHTQLGSVLRVHVCVRCAVWFRCSTHIFFCELKYKRTHLNCMCMRLICTCVSVCMRAIDMQTYTLHSLSDILCLYKHTLTPCAHIRRYIDACLCMQLCMYLHRDTLFVLIHEPFCTSSQSNTHRHAHLHERTLNCAETKTQSHQHSIRASRTHSHIHPCTRTHSHQSNARSRMQRDCILLCLLSIDMFANLVI